MKKLIIGLLLLLFLQIAKGQDIKETSELQRPLLIGVQFGGSLLMASSENSEKAMRSIGIPGSQAEAYYKQLKRGWNISSDIYYMTSDKFGIGAKYSFYSSGASQDFTIKIPSTLPEYIYIGMEERIYVNYIGPSIIFRYWLGKNRKFQFTETISVGRVLYRDELRIAPTSFPLLNNSLAKGGTYGVDLGISFDYYPLSWMSVGANIGFMNAGLSSMEVFSQGKKQTVNLGKDNKESLKRFNYSLGIRFYL